MRRQAEVIVIGGGVIGCSIAWHLADRGVTDILLVERGRLAGGATGICPGGIRQQFEGDADCRLAQRSVRFYERINELLAPEHALRFERSGYLFLAHDDELLERFRQNVRRQNALGIPSELLSSADIGARWPALAPSGVRGGAFCGEDGFLEDCDGVTHAFAARARARGTRVLFDEVRALERRAEAWEVRTASGGPLHASSVVIAAGADSAALARTAGLDLPIVAEVRRLAYTAPCETLTVAPLVVAPGRGFAGKQLANGVFYLGWIGESAGADDLTFIERALSAGAGIVPVLVDLPVRRIVRGVYDNTPDRRPILGPAPQQPGLFLAAGFSGHGFMVAPAVGELLAASIAGGPEDSLLAAFSLGRFTRPGDWERELII